MWHYSTMTEDQLDAAGTAFANDPEYWAGVMGVNTLDISIAIRGCQDELELRQQQKTKLDFLAYRYRTDAGYRTG